MVERLLQTLIRNGMRRGVLGGSQAWAVVWLAAFAYRRWGLRRPQVVYSETLGVGDRLEIVHHQPEVKRRKRSGKRSRQPVEGGEVQT
jgi:hypothetical protein